MIENFDKYFISNGLSPWETWAFCVLLMVGIWLVVTGSLMYFAEKKVAMTRVCRQCYQAQTREKGGCEYCGYPMIVEVWK